MTLEPQISRGPFLANEMKDKAEQLFFPTQS